MFVAFHKNLKKIPGILGQVTWRAPGKSLPISPHQFLFGAESSSAIHRWKGRLGTVGNAALIYHHLPIYGYLWLVIKWEASDRDSISIHQASTVIHISSTKPLWIRQWKFGTSMNDASLKFVGGKPLYMNHFGHLEFTSVLRTFDMWPVRAKRKTHSNKSGSRSKNSRPS